MLVRINDRGPFVDDRIIDLSYTAAREIEMIGPGTAPVRVEVLDPGLARAGADRRRATAAARSSSPPAAPDAAPVAAPIARRRRIEPPAPGRSRCGRAEVAATAPIASRYAVQVGAFADYEHARRTQRSLESRGASRHAGARRGRRHALLPLRLGPVLPAR